LIPGNSPYSAIANAIDGNTAVTLTSRKNDNGEYFTNILSYRFSNGVWNLEQTIETPFLIPSPLNNQISISNNQILIGGKTKTSNSAELYTYDGTKWNRSATLSSSDGFQGISGVALDGRFAAIAGWTQKYGQAVYMFERNKDTGVWEQKARLVPLNFEGYMGFGLAMALSGQHLVVSDPSDSSAYFFRRVSGAWTFMKKVPSISSNLFLYDSFDPVSVDQDFAVIGVADANNNTGEANLYHFDGTEWKFSKKLTSPEQVENAQFGRLTAISGYNVYVSGKGSTGPALYYFDIKVDSDSDGLLDYLDNCPNQSNVDQKDTDKDGKGDVCDTDDDNDSVLDAVDNCPGVVNPSQLDTDNDGKGNACDKDDDNDGVLDTADNCSLTVNPKQPDADGDGIGNACDKDFDNDGVENTVDNCPNTPNANQKDTDNDKTGDVCDPDIDNDSVLNEVDNCVATKNLAQKDIDDDGKGDLCDIDIDGDGILNDKDNCSMVSNISQDDSDGDKIGDACDPDQDNDGVANDNDNCPMMVNPDQSDQDSDHQGDVCDGDTDGDGTANEVDNCPIIANSSQNDFDKDGIGDACDSDADGDSIANGNDLCPFSAIGGVVHPETGCTLDQMVPCSGPLGSTEPWGEHGDYVSSFTHAADTFVSLGLITQAERDRLVSQAAGSQCGK
jgi:hypothetical protein